MIQDWDNRALCDVDHSPVLSGAWGANGRELLLRATDSTEQRPLQFGSLTMLTPPDLTIGGRCCWLFGEVSGGATLVADTRPPTRADMVDVLARSIDARDEEACDVITGQFVLVCLDNERDRCTITRDQLGAHPLVYAKTVNGVIFAEHERTVLHLLARTPSPDRFALLQWLEDGGVQPGRTLFDGISRVMAGHRLVLTPESSRARRWWELRFAGVEEEDKKVLAMRVRESSFAAINRASVGHSRLAVKLSGGLDSACVAAGVSANQGVARNALAIGSTFPFDPAADEANLIEATARHTGLALELVRFDRTASIMIPAMKHIERWRLPPATPNLFVWQPLMQQARSFGVTLMLDGEGGDELFGAAYYLLADMIRRGQLSAAWRLMDRLARPGRASPRFRVRLIRQFGSHALVPRRLLSRYDAYRRSSYSIVRRADARELVELLQPNENELRDGPLWWRFLVECLIDERDLLGVSTHFRREATDERIARRHPFLHDLRLIEAMLRIPPKERLPAGIDRPLLREALKGLIPEAVRTRNAKSHFSGIVLAGMQNDEALLIAPLRRRDAPIRDYVDAAELDRKLDVAPGDRMLLDAGFLWHVAIANSWLVSLEGQRSRSLSG